MGAFHYAKDSGNFGRNSNEKDQKFVSVSSERNIRDHLWKWSTYLGRNILPKFAVPFLANRFFALIREFGKRI